MELRGFKEYGDETVYHRAKSCQRVDKVPKRLRVDTLVGGGEHHS